MLLRIIDNLVESLVARLCLNPIYVAPRLQDVLQEHVLWATPKHRTPIRKIWSKKYGHENWPIGQKLIKSKRNITTCLECGNFHEYHTICRHCFTKVQEKVKNITEKEKPKPVWFAPNLSQKAANTPQTGDKAAEFIDKTIKET